MQTGFLGHLSYIQWQAFSCSIKNAKYGISTNRSLRGRHEPKNKTPEEDVQFVRAHIQSFPTESSHYCRKDNPNRRYLSSDLTIKKMYDLYIEKCNAELRTPVKENVYREIFNTKFNLSFGSPKSDTCNRCDLSQTSLKTETDEQKHTELTVQLELHQRKAQSGYNNLKSDKELAAQDPSISLISSDLQQVLPTPYLSTNVVFYKRQLSVYNLGVNEVATGKSFMHMWPETDGGRGSEDVASCLLRYIKEEKGGDVKHIIAFSDTCGGQNRNFNVASFWIYCINCELVECVDHKFMYSGHSFLPNDRDFGSIEQRKRQVQTVYVPQQWYDLVRTARRHKPFVVKEMKQSDFKSFQEVREHMVNRKTNTDGEKVSWLKIQSMRFHREHPWQMKYRHSLNEIEAWKTVDFQKRVRGRPVDLKRVQLPSLYEASREISKAKFDDLMQLLSYIPPVHHRFYHLLKPKEIQAIASGNETSGEES